MKWKVPLFKSYWEEDDVKSVSDVIRRGTYWAAGPELVEFEKLVSDFVGTKYALCFNSGTSALHSALISYEIKGGDEIIVPSFTFIATGNAPLFVNAKPVFADIEDETYGLDAKDVKNKITSKTKAIMPIHYGGCPCRDIKALKELADDHNLLLLEDAAQSLGSCLNEKKVGTFGDAAMFSLCQDKMITTGEGGLIVTDSRDCFEKMKLIRSHGRAESSDYFSSSELMDYVNLGFNFRMPTMVAALGISQIKKIDKTIKMRRENAEHYRSRLSKIKDITLPTTNDNYFHVYQKFTIRMKNKDTRDRLKDHLSKNGIFSKAYFGLPIHLTKFYKESFGYKEGLLTKTEELAKRVLTLPMFPALRNEEIDYVAKIIAEFFEVE